MVRIKEKNYLSSVTKAHRVRVKDQVSIKNKMLWLKIKII